ncbi:hypothetical protein OQA88_2137 [Cercophora sp. LCS_1]
MTLVRGLNLRYLWVDLLCLSQDYQVDLERGVKAMDRIYEQAWLTVIAADGKNANAGLPGIPGIETDNREERPALHEIKAGIHLGVFMTPDVRLKKTVYETRAYQEHSLLRRKLYFFDNEVVFRCNRRECFESYLDGVKREILGHELKVSRTFQGALEMHRPLADYADVLGHFTGRTLAYQHGTLQGLPIGAFDRFLFSGTNLCRHHGFPSYSFSGWIGRASFNNSDYSSKHWLNYWLNFRTWIIWYKRSPNGVLSLVWDPAANPSFPKSNPWFEAYRGRTQFEASLLEVDTTQTIPPHEPPSLTKLSPSCPLLQFYTAVIFLKLEDLNVLTSRATLIGRDIRVCGHIIVDSLEEKQFLATKGPVEVALLSESSGRPDLHLRGAAWCYSGSLRIARVAPEFRFDFYNVMIVERGKGLAERRGTYLERHRPSEL